MAFAKMDACLVSSHMTYFKMEMKVDTINLLIFAAFNFHVC